ncbi:MAG: ADP-ribosylation factor-like protein [Chloroflexi bacterium]|nr:ADP-ribosylation factor-like protein [Chloroflexota bacterium]MCL5946896.1 ADP-ribosylation factor-like protein [Chloroflexota bacterium]
MARIDLQRRFVQLKLVYAGPSGSGKTTNLLRIRELFPSPVEHSPLLLSAEGTRTVFFDALPIEVGEIQGLKLQLFVYAVPGEEFFVATRALIMSNADALAYVVDSQGDHLEHNRDSLAEVERVLTLNQRSAQPVPIVLQYNKRDLPGATDIALLEATLNQKDRPVVEAVAVKGTGVLETLQRLCVEAVKQLQK